MGVVTSAGSESHIEELWNRMQPLAATRIDVLESALAAVVAGRYDQQLIDDALLAAHKLIGALGTYGRPAGSAAALQAEAALLAEPPDVAGLQAAVRRLRGIVTAS